MYIYPQKNKSDDFACAKAIDTVYTEGLENTPPRYAIVKRNKWMIEHSDYVVTNVRQYATNAGKFKRMAERKGRIVINLADD